MPLAERQLTHATLLQILAGSCGERDCAPLCWHYSRISLAHTPHTRHRRALRQSPRLLSPVLLLKLPTLRTRRRPGWLRPSCWRSTCAQ